MRRRYAIHTRLDVAIGLMRVLVINSGSSTYKLWYAEVRPEIEGNPEPPEWTAKLENPSEGIAATLKQLEHPVDVVGHRIVHGGPLRDPALLTPEVRQTIADAAQFAPTHNRFALGAIDAAAEAFGAQLPQVAVFDTGFHKTIPPPAYIYPGPREWLDLGIRRYGFHGINHGYIARRSAALLGSRPTRLISLHLGNGASLCAIRDGESIDTTMGFTPLEGLMMGTRSGSVDPAILISLIRRFGYSAADLDRILNKESGLKGLSGHSGDMREVRKLAAAGDQNAGLALEVYAHRLARETGSMLGSLGGVDALAFTGGIGENTPELRAGLCERLHFLGVELDQERNAVERGDGLITTAASRVKVLVVKAQEEWEIAQKCVRIAGSRVPFPTSGVT